jgi:hypothetical protein
MHREAFLAAVRDLTGFETSMIAELTTLAPRLSAKQREQALVKLKPLNADLTKARALLQQLCEEANSILQRCRREFKPQVLRAEEEADRDSEATQAEFLLS